ncbi:acyl-CoA dehydrogenase family protein [Aeromicrobium alkaliterrae]|uniref:Acyl-CoA dehydrogenase n=1 Tax=Aeromicrobium alkaliterrae TaxID=302168 RepID=A0ABP4WBB5_9ACTN
MPAPPARTVLTHEDLLPHTAEPWPQPGAGRTADRWTALRDLATRDLPLVKLVEPHHDAAAILQDLGLPGPAADEIWAVWAAEPPFAVLTATQHDDGWTLSGTKAFCSGASLVTHALVTAETDDGSRLFAVDVGAEGIHPDGGARPWTGAGMRRAGTATLTFERVAARPVGAAGAYVDRPGFWLGAIGIAVCWIGGACGVAATLEAAADRLDPHGRAHLGATRSALDTAWLAIRGAADLVDDEDLDGVRAERLAQSLRAHAADVAATVVEHVDRALGPGPLAFDAAHAEHVHDLQVFVRQHHAERDLARLGSLEVIRDA